VDGETNGAEDSGPRALWLNCYLGEPGLIGTGIYQRIAEHEQLKLRMPPRAGLIPDFAALRGPSFDPGAVDSRIRHFYEHAAEYHLEVWSEVYFVGRFFLWLLVEFLSRRMDQLNFPISSLKLAKGMTSEVLQLYEPATERLVSTGWLRRMKSTRRVIYAGIYSTIRIPRQENPCVKVTFPCRGSANVYLRPVAHADGSFGLDSSGSGFGKSSFYWWNRGRNIAACGISRPSTNCSGCMWIGGSATDGPQDFVCLADHIAAALQDYAAGQTKIPLFRASRCPSRGTSSLRLSWNFSLR
jgi:hypothetical protein